MPPTTKPVVAHWKHSATPALFQGDLDQARSWWSELATVGRRAGETYYELIGHVGFVMALAYGGQHGCGAQVPRRD